MGLRRGSIAWYAAKKTAIHLKEMADLLSSAKRLGVEQFKIIVEYATKYWNVPGHVFIELHDTPAEKIAPSRRREILLKVAQELRKQAEKIDTEIR